MNMEKLPARVMLYGTVMSLGNRIQTLGDRFFNDITTKQHFVLMTIGLFEDKNPSLKEVADIVGCSYQNIKNICLALERKGYVKIEKDSADRRKYCLIRTIRSEQWIRQTLEEVAVFFDRMFFEVSDDKIKSVLSILEKINRNLTEHNDPDAEGK